jgi:hypothetical protein
MPGAGKTTIARALARSGCCVLGEYTSTTAGTVPLHKHPAVNDDYAHQTNWLRKAAQTAQELAAGRSVFVDRDWLSSLAYAYSIADTDDAALLAERIRWADTHVNAGSLLVADAYAVFDLDGDTSLRRRSTILRRAHPWSQLGVLERLRTFYRDPVRLVHRLSPQLAASLRTTNWFNLSGTDSHHRLMSLVQAIGDDI